MTINLTNRVSDKIDAIDARVEEARAQVDAYLEDAHRTLPFVNVMPQNVFKLTPDGTNPSWPGFIYNPNGDWAITDDYLPLSTTTDPAITELVSLYKLGRHTLSDWYCLKVTIDAIGTGTLSIGTRYSSAGIGTVSGGYLWKDRDQDWALRIQTKSNIEHFEGDWGARIFIESLNPSVGDVFYFALPFATPGIPQTVPWPPSMISVHASQDKTIY